jgi:hypothetical protein
MSHKNEYYVNSYNSFKKQYLGKALMRISSRFARKKGGGKSRFVNGVKNRGELSDER